MKKTILIVIAAVLLLLNDHSQAAATSKSCKLPKGEVLTIGCTYECGKWNTWAVNWYARKLGYKVKLIDLSSKNQTIDYTQVDGVIIPGGVDIDPVRYKYQVTPEMKAHIEKYEHLAVLTENGKKRDAFEFDFLEKYFSNPAANNQPILGICRGMQVLTVSQGLPLYVDIKAELGIKNRRYTLDKVHVQNNESLIKELIGRKRFRAVELHHQGLSLPYYEKHKAQWPHLEITGLSNKNRIVEVLEFHNRPIIGVQFHPEFTFGRVRRGLFKWLLNSSCINHQLSKKN